MEFYLYPIRSKFQSSSAVVLELEQALRQTSLIEGIPAAIQHPKDKSKKDFEMSGLGVL